MRWFGMVLMLPLSILIQDRMNIQHTLPMEANTRDGAIYASLKQKAYNILTIRSLL